VPDAVARAYLDHASATPLRPAALTAMLPYLQGPRADPGRVHTEGSIVRVAVEQAREQVAALVGARPREVVFTSSGVEATNAAVFGAIARHRERAPGRPVHVVTTAVEHSAVREAAERSDEVTVVGVDGLGRVDPAEVVAAIGPDTALVSVQVANHEVGTIQPVSAVVAACRERGVLVHVDASASVGHLALDFVGLGADLCSVEAHQLGGPAGVGALLVRRGLRVPPLLLGGAQERARRAGLEDVPAIVGFGAACAELGAGVLAVEADVARAQVEELAVAALGVDGVIRHGDPVDRLPHVLCLGVAGVEAEPVLISLDRAGVAVHSGSSCSSEALEPSPVLAAMGVDADRSLRISVGWTTEAAEIARFAQVFGPAVARLRALRTGSPGT
jgi:cysteine desulfurase